jgi:hypothetical protein
MTEVIGGEAVSYDHSRSFPSFIYRHLRVVMSRTLLGPDLTRR